MSSTPSTACEAPAPAAAPAWLAALLTGVPVAEAQPLRDGAVVTPCDGAAVTATQGERLIVEGGVLRADGTVSDRQAQTRDSFAHVWSDADRFASPKARRLLDDWYQSHYGPAADAPWWAEYGESPLLLEAGCGVGHSAIGLFGDRLRQLRYLGVDISPAIDVAARRLTAMGVDAGFIRADLNALPLPDACADVIYSQGVLHHTDDTEAAFHALARLLKPGGRFLFYVYRRKGPIREFTDDLIRDRLAEMTQEEGWRALTPLTRLGEALGRLNLVVDVPEAVTLLDIPKGPIDIQRLFYWHVFKAFYHPDLTLDEMNHINFDWYAPRNAHRHTPEEVAGWCAAAGLDIERLHLQEAGITVIARKGGKGAPCAG